MRKLLFMLVLIFIAGLCLASRVSALENLKYIGEIALEKNSKPVGLTLDASGNLYLLDSESGKIAIYNRSGNLVDKKTLGNGKLFGKGGEIALDKNGNFIVVDNGSCKVYKLSPEFKELFAVGESGRSESQFKEPAGLTVDLNDNFYVADSGNRRIQVFNADGIFFGQVKSGERSAKPNPAVKPLPELTAPAKVVVDEERDLYVLDTAQAVVHVYNAQGSPVLSVAMKEALKSGNLEPLDLAVGNEKIFVLTAENIQVFNAKTGALLTHIGSKGKGRGQFLEPAAMGMLDNLIYILDAGNKRVQILEYGEKKSKAHGVERTLDEKTKIAVFPFKDTRSISKEKEFGETVSEMFITACVNTKNFVVIERKEIARVLDELKFNLTDMVDVNTAKKVGKILGVDYAIVGSVAVFDDAKEIDVRFIQLETGAIVLAESKRASDEVNLRKSVEEIVAKIERIYVNRVGAPQAPGGLYSLGKAQSVYLRWGKNPEEDVQSFKIFRAASKEGEFAPVGTATALEYTDTNLNQGSEYFYRISAVNAKGVESKMSEVIACKPREDPPYGGPLKASAKASAKKCKLAWNESEKEVKEYQVFRLDPEAKDYALIGKAPKPQFEDAGVEPGKTYAYKLKKVFQNGQETQCSEPFSCQTSAR